MRLTAALILAAATFTAVPVSPFATASAWAIAQPGKAVDLRPKFKKGDAHRFKMELDTKGVEGPAAAPQEQTIKQEIGLKITVIDTAPEQGATLELEYESLMLDLKMSGMAMKFDSKNPPAQDDSQIAAALRPVVGTKLTIKTDNAGRITSVSGGDNLMQGPSAGVASQFTGADVIRNMFGPIVSMKSGDGTANVGETWTNSTTMDAPMGKMNMQTNNTLKSASGGTAVIDITGTMSLDNSSTSAAMPAVAIKDSKITGEARWDTEAGMLNSMETQQELLVEAGRGADASKSQHTMKMKVTRVK